MFHTFTHLLKCSGLRPGEALRLRWKDVTIEDHKRWSETQGKEVSDYKATLIVKTSKTGKPRLVPCRSNLGEHLMKFLEFQKGEVTVSEDTLLFGSPEQLMEKTYSHRHLDNSWRDVISACQSSLSTSPFSDRPFTLYSLRSTFVMDCIYAGIDIYVTAQLCGHSVKVLETYYARYDIQKAAPKIQHIERGKRKGVSYKIQLIDNELHSRQHTE